MKILVIMLEIQSASGICTKNVIDEFKRNGDEVDIITYATENRISSEGEYVIAPKLLLRRRKGQNPFTRKIMLFLYKVQILMFGFLWPLNSPFFLMKLYSKARQLYKKKKYDLVISVYTQIDPVIVGYLLKKRYKELKYVAYFLDSLSGGPIPWFLSKKRKIMKGRKWEDKILSNADGIVFMESSRKHHEIYSIDAKHYSKVKYLDIPMMKKSEFEHKNCAKVENDELIIAYVGSLPLSIRNPFYTFELLAQIKDVHLTINMIGENLSAEQYVRKCEKLIKINWIGQLSHEDALDYLMQADILLNIGNRVPEMVPSKIFEYMSLKKPILSVAPIKEEPSIPYLNKYPNACLVYERDGYDVNMNKVASFFSRIKEGKLVQTDVYSLFENNRPESFCVYCDEIVNKNNDM